MFVYKNLEDFHMFIANNYLLSNKFKFNFSQKEKNSNYKEKITYKHNIIINIFFLLEYYFCI